MNFKPYRSEASMLKKFANTRKNDGRLRNHVVIGPRQCGKTTIAVIYTLWRALRQSNLSIIIYTSKLDLCKEFLYRVAELRDLLRVNDMPTFTIRNKECLTFSNGSRIRIASTTSRLRGQNCDLMIIDEAAFIQDPEDFLYCAFPTYASSKDCQMIFLSTPRGTDNYLYDLYVKAYNHKNEFIASRMYTDDIPNRTKFDANCTSFLSLTGIMREVMCIFWGNDNENKQRKKK